MDWKDAFGLGFIVLTIVGSLTFMLSVKNLIDNEQEKVCIEHNLLFQRGHCIERTMEK